LNFDLVIVGGGLAGLCSALHLSKKGLKVLLIEKHAYPKHKVCGEYISNEVIPYLTSLGFDPFEFGAKKITDFVLSTPGSRSLSTKLPLGGFSISRFKLDSELAKSAQAAGATIVHDTVVDIDFESDRFTIRTKTGVAYSSGLLIGSFGKRSNLDVKMNRAFIKRPSHFLGVKAHYKGDFPEEAVGLHNFEGGYCGVSKVENDHINVCYLADYDSFKRFKNIEEFQTKVLSKNSFLKKVFADYDLVFERPLSISQISFESKNPVEDHVIMCGDSAGMIHPLAGNGMSMAIRAAQMASQEILKFSSGEIESRSSLEESYTKKWNKEFSSRLKSGHIISRLFRLGPVSELIMLCLKAFPFLLPFIIKRTHGSLMRPEL